jgi:hypothetical protein
MKLVQKIDGMWNSNFNIINNSASGQYRVYERQILINQVLISAYFGNLPVDIRASPILPLKS